MWVRMNDIYGGFGMRDDVIFKITKENGTLVSRVRTHMNSDKEIDELIDKLKESVRVISNARNGYQSDSEYTIYIKEDQNE